MTQVWVVESGEYSQRGIVLVGASLDAARQAVIAQYAPPYIVEWEPVVNDAFEDWILVGNFEQVLGKSMKHRAEFTITPYEVHDG